MNLVYKYALSAPDDAARDLVFKQLRAAHAYKLDLIQIERGRRAATRALLDVECAEAVVAVRQAEAHAQEEASAVLKERAARRTLRVDTRNRDDARKLAAEARRVLFAARRAAQAKLEIDLLLLDAKVSELKRSVREHTPCYWGTYLLIEDAVGRAAAAPLYQLDGVSPNDPRFERWEGTGVLGVQLQGGLSVAKACGGTDRRLRIDAPAPAAWAPNRGGVGAPGEGFRKKRALLRQDSKVHLRIGSDGRAPIWGTWEMDMHRGLPPEAIIKWATVQRERHGPLYRWALCVTFAVPDFVEPPRPGSVAIDVGWRQMGEEIRVCCWRGSDGAEGELRLSLKDIYLLRAPEELRSLRDHRLEMVRGTLWRWLKAFATVPDWLRAATENFHAWRAPYRFVRLLGEWRDHRFEGDERPFCALEAFVAQDRADWEDEAKRRLRALARRTCKYKEFAAMLAQRYGTIVLEQFDLRTVARLNEDEAENMTARSNRQLVGTSLLRDALVIGARSRGGIVALVSAVDSTRTCVSCGVVETFDAAASVTRACSACGHVLDQDKSAAEVLLSRYCERPGDAKIAAGARKEKKESEIEGSRWVKARERGAEKKEKLAAARAARETAGNSAE